MNSILGDESKTQINLPVNKGSYLYSEMKCSSTIKFFLDVTRLSLETKIISNKYHLHYIIVSLLPLQDPIKYSSLLLLIGLVVQKLTHPLNIIFYQWVNTGEKNTNYIFHSPEVSNFFILFKF